MSKKFKFLVIILFLTLLLSGCGIPQRQALSSQNRTEIKSNQTLLNTTQNGIRVQPNNWFNSKSEDPYNPMDSGSIVRTQTGYVQPSIVGMLIVGGVEKYETSKSKKSLNSIRTQLDNYDYLNNFKSDLNKNLSSLKWLKLEKIKTQYNIKDSARELVDSAKQNTILFVGTTYALNSTFERLEVSAYVKLEEKQKNGMKPKTLYSNNFYYIYRLEPDNNSSAQNISVWTQNNDLLLRKKLSEASSMLSKLIASDISNPNPLFSGANDQVVSVRTVYGPTIDGVFLKKENGYTILSLKSDGSIYVVNSLK